jgi:hypothetical protein
MPGKLIAEIKRPSKLNDLYWLVAHTGFQKKTSLHSKLLQRKGTAI